MGEQFKKKHISAGLLAHVDAGKTTLSEALLYVSGAKRTLGRQYGKLYRLSFHVGICARLRP